MFIDNIKEYVTNVLRFVCLSVRIHSGNTKLLIHKSTVLPCNSTEVHGRFERIYYLHFQSRKEAKDEDGSNRGSMFLRNVHKIIPSYRALNPTSVRTTQFSGIKLCKNILTVFR